MRAIVAAIGFCVVSLAPVAAWGEGPPEATKTARPMVYALFAAVGDQFTYMIEVRRTGTYLPPYRTHSVTEPDNLLNMFVLRSLDKAIAATDPDSKRILMTLRGTAMDAASLHDREDAALDQIMAELKNMPQRQEWDRIVIATPAYKAFESNGVAGRLAGFGVFYEPVLGNLVWRHNLFFFNASEGYDAVTPENKFIRSRRYAAPFSFIDVWVLDPKTLQVLDRQRRFDALKLFDPKEDDLHITQNVSEKVLMTNAFNLIDRSVSAAVAHSEVLNLGIVHVGDPKRVESGKKDD
jgi:hypothetical protein